MTVTHTVSLDMMNPQTPQRIHVKQGDMGSRALEVLLFNNGEPFPLDDAARPALRWSACNPDTGESASGICDSLPDGSPLFQFYENQMYALLPSQMLALPGLVQADLLLVTPEKTLATFNFEFYVNPAAADGNSPGAESFYKLSSLDQINTAIAALQTWQETMDENFANLEHEVFELKRIVNEA